jgi:hypothetical protein
LLNVYLHHLVDQKSRKQQPDVPVLRWADDLLVPCRTTGEAQQAYEDLRRLLTPTGMKQKGTPEDTVRDLRDGAAAEWLGYRLLAGAEELKVEVSQRAWNNLKQKLELAHDEDNSPLVAIQTIIGWIGAMGPCFMHTDVSQAYARIGAMARDLALDEVPTEEEVRHHWRTAHLRWCCSRKVGADVHGALADGSARRVTKTGRQ